ncbi:MAG: LuxR C-terminal-related transcriptional regulator [Chloroflexi bacterium]|nr:LuxR C-terminal-related transcriptional regulator [Chloroflexota bacterium]
MRLSDVMGQRRYRQTSVYQDYFAVDLVEHLLDVGLPAASGWQRSFLFCRQRGDGEFSERDRLVLDVLRPHFSNLEAEAALRRRLAEVLKVADDGPEQARYAGLTAREREVVTLVAEGKTNAQIAADLWVAPGTVKKHLENVYAKLGVGRRAAAAAFVRQHH